ncbi:hypothetical protein [Neokomagataea anthophila]|uniref:Lipoprotein n=1 Tax=Neokomagataea anthophila TaxID=2826925 RepID=A0ABS5E5P2_9PROT|nr:hypothetical protein [Neokomagataea anthophila]MBR0559217.1 hypothetical protein [Neokomagataea anthophila]
MFRAIQYGALVVLGCASCLLLGACDGGGVFGPGAPMVVNGAGCQAGIYTCKPPMKVPFAVPCSCTQGRMMDAGNAGQR